MWLFGGVSIPLYIITFCRIFFRKGNKSHILQSIASINTYAHTHTHKHFFLNTYKQMTFLHFFYMLGAGTTMLIGGVLLIQEVQILLQLQTKEIAGMMAGCLLSIFFYVRMLTNQAINYPEQLLTKTAIISLL